MKRGLSAESLGKDAVGGLIPSDCSAHRKRLQGTCSLRDSFFAPKDLGSLVANQQVRHPAFQASSLIAVDDALSSTLVEQNCGCLLQIPGFIEVLFLNSTAELS